MTDEKALYLRHRISFAREAYTTAELCIKNQLYRGAINRLYYACFYAVSALLLQFGKSAKTHSGIRTLFNESIIRKGLLPQEYRKLYSELFDVRHEADYSDLVEIDPIQILDWLSQVKRFIDAVEQLIPACRQ